MVDHGWPPLGDAEQAPPAPSDGWSWRTPEQTRDISQTSDTGQTCDPSQTYVDDEPGTSASAPLPAWADEILDADDPVDTSGIDPRTVMWRFVQDVRSFLSAEERRRVLRAGMLAMRGRLDDGGT